MLRKFHISSQQINSNEIHQALLGENCLRFFVGSLVDFKTDIPHLKTLLSTEELQRATKFRFDIHRDTYIVSHALLKLQLSKEIGISLALINIEYFDGTKPHLKKPPFIDFNLSHSQDIFTFTIGDESSLRVGIDIEKINQAFNFQSIIDSYMHPKEIEYITNKALSKTEKQTKFYEIWTRKEAFLKMHGIGIITDLASLDTASPKNTSSFQVPDSIAINTSHGTIYSYSTLHYALSISVNTSTKPVLAVLKA